mgnify:CR=1 FL=1
MLRPSEQPDRHQSMKNRGHGNSNISRGHRQGGNGAGNADLRYGYRPVERKRVSRSPTPLTAI